MENYLVEPDMKTQSSKYEQVPRFDREFFGAKHRFTRIGDGSLGGKAKGLARVKELLTSELDGTRFRGIDVEIPTLVVITTQMFDTFVEHNHLHD